MDQCFIMVFGRTYRFGDQSAVFSISHVPFPRPKAPTEYLRLMITQQGHIGTCKNRGTVFESVHVEEYYLLRVDFNPGPQHIEITMSRCAVVAIIVGNS